MALGDTRQRLPLRCPFWSSHASEGSLGLLTVALLTCPYHPGLATGKGFLALPLVDLLSGPWRFPPEVSDYCLALAVVLLHPCTHHTHQEILSFGPVKSM